MQQKWIYLPWFISIVCCQNYFFESTYFRYLKNLKHVLNQFDRNQRKFTLNLIYAMQYLTFLFDVSISVSRNQCLQTQSRSVICIAWHFNSFTFQNFAIPVQTYIYISLFMRLRHESLSLFCNRRKLSNRGCMSYTSTSLFLFFFVLSCTVENCCFLPMHEINEIISDKYSFVYKISNLQLN